MCKEVNGKPVSPLSLLKAADPNLQRDSDRGSNKIYKRMSSTVLCVVILLTCTLTFSAAQTSCRGRCGTEYYRGFMCQCDYTCLLYDECCRDYEYQCTTRDSCKGRCGETFKRGRRCSCDSGCVEFEQCCPDYKTHCDAEEPTLNEAGENSKLSEGYNADELMSLVSPTSYLQDDLGDDTDGQIFPKDESNGPEDPETSPIPKSAASGDGLSTADPLDQSSAEPTQRPDSVEFSTEAFTALSQTEAKGSDAGGLTDPGATLPRPTASADPVSNQNSATANIPELETVGQAGDGIFTEAQNTHPTVSSVTTEQTQSSSTGPENTPVVTTTIAPSSTPASQSSSTDQENTEITTSIAPSSTPASQSSSTDLESTEAMTTLIPHTDSVRVGTTNDATPGRTTADPLNATPDPTKRTSSGASSKPQDGVVPYKPTPDKPAVAKPSSKPETKPVDTAPTLNTGNPREYQADDSNLCNGRPVSAVTTLSNGTVAVFREHLFWFLDRYRVPGPALSITQLWGVPSPIDTVFTRCNCQGKTYIFKGAQYWRFENAVLDAGYPKHIATGFDGLRGQITAALSVPQYKRRRESVYFFKRGGVVQKYSYQFGASRTCGRNVQYTDKSRRVRQTVSLLGPAINIRTSWRGFPSTITAAVSIRSTGEPEGYKYYVFSRSKSYNVRVDGERPVIDAPTVTASPQSDVFKCPKIKK